MLKIIYGDVEEAKICTDKQTGKSRGFGFVKFYDWTGDEGSITRIIDDAFSFCKHFSKILIKYPSYSACCY